MSDKTAPQRGRRTLLIFTDLDGSLLDHFTYSFAEAQLALDVLERLKIPWIPNTSKTFAELQPLRAQLDHTGPFVVENGAAIYIPGEHPLAQFASLDKINGYAVQRFGKLRCDLLELLEPLRSRYRFTSFSELTPSALAQLTGLGAVQAQQALQRDYSEPLHWRDTETALVDLRLELAEAGVQVQRGGRFVHLMGQHDKAEALRWLAAQLGWAKTVALGDGENDIEMLSAADIPVIIRSPVHPPLELPNRPDALVTAGLGPAGWNEAILKILSTCDSKASSVTGAKE